MHMICASVVKGIGENGRRVLPTAPSYMGKQYSPDFSSSWVTQVDFVFVYGWHNTRTFSAAALLLLDKQS